MKYVNVIAYSHDGDTKVMVCQDMRWSSMLHRAGIA